MGHVEAHSHDFWAERLTDEELDAMIKGQSHSLFMAQHTVQLEQFKLNRLQREQTRRGRP